MFTFFKRQQIIPAVLTNSLSELDDKLKQISSFSAWAQIDIMDNQFVPNKSIPITSLFDISYNINLSIHLMVLNPQDFFEDCKKGQVKRVIFHFEATNNPQAIIDKMKNYTFEKGMAINPHTSIDKIIPYLDQLDMILFLGVNPGFQNQQFIPSVLNKIKKIKEKKINLKIGVDGGIKLSNARVITDAGADYLIIGSALFESNHPFQTFKKFKKII